MIHRRFLPQKKVLGPGTFQDSAVGHLIVLLQYDWPTEEPVFSKVRTVGHCWMVGQC